MINEDVAFFIPMEYSSNFRILLPGRSQILGVFQLNSNHYSSLYYKQ